MIMFSQKSNNTKKKLFTFDYSAEKCFLMQKAGWIKIKEKELSQKSDFHKTSQKV